MDGVAPVVAPPVSASTATIDDAATSEDPEDRSASVIEFQNRGLANAWALATTAAVPHREPVPHVSEDEGARALADQVEDARAGLAEPEVEFGTPASRRTARSDTRARSEPARDRNRQKTLSIRVAVAVAVVAVVGVVMVHPWRSTGGASDPATAVPPDRAPTVVQTSCNAVSGVAFFTGSLTNGSETPLSYRVDVTFTGQNGRTIGHGSKLVDLLLPGGTSAIDVRTAAPNVLTSCKATATRVRNP